MDKSNVGPELAGFSISVASIVLKFIVILIAAVIVGFEVSAIIGVLAGVVLAIGLALQGFLENLHPV